MSAATFAEGDRTKRGNAAPPWDGTFLALLNDRAGRRKDHRGFVVLVRRQQSLQRLQALCFEQNYNTCLTARYRLESEPIFGTLVAALLSDLALWNKDDAPPFVGDVLPAPSSATGWGNWIPAFLDDVGWQRDAPRQSGALDAELDRFLDAAHRLLRTGQRLVIFAEVAGPTPPDEWTRGFERLLDRLPQRVGVVLSGAPPEFHLPTGDHRFLEIDAVPDAGTAVETYRYRDAALFADRPTPDDRLGVGRFADALARLVLLPETGPMTIGIHGPWGQGKSSFMQLIERALIRHAPENRPRQPELAERDERMAQCERALEEPDADQIAVRSELAQLMEERSALWQTMEAAAEQHVVTVRFNAWQFEDATQIWAGLAHTITRRFEATLPRRARLWTRIRYAWEFRRAQLLVDFALPGIAAVLFAALLAIVGTDWLDQWLADDPLETVAGVAALPTALVTVVTAWLLARRARTVLRPISERVLDYIRMPDYRDRMGFQHEVLRDLIFARDRLGARRGLRRAAERPRVVVFIDDLDRCSDEKIVDTLQAINLILGPDASGFYVFLGIDTEMVERAIGRRYGADKDGGKRDGALAHRYLRKIIQLSFHLSYSMPRELLLVPDARPTETFLRHLFSPAARRRPRVTDGAQPDGSSIDGSAPDTALRYDHSVLREPVVHLLKEVEDTPVELKAFVDFHDFLGENPRELKRLVNAHRLIKIILQRPDVPMTEHDQRKLVKWLMFSARWPDLIDDVFACAEAKLPGDCIHVLCKTRRFQDQRLVDQLQTFASRAPELSADDVKESGALAFAAQITTHVLPDLLPELDQDSEAAAPPSS